MNGEPVRDERVCGESVYAGGDGDRDGDCDGNGSSGGRVCAVGTRNGTQNITFNFFE